MAGLVPAHPMVTSQRRSALLDARIKSGHDASGGEIRAAQISRRLVDASDGVPPRGMARRKTHTYGVRLTFPETAGASRRAIRGVLFGVGPRFRPVRRASKAPTEPSASSWQGLLVVPGGAPAPPGCLIA